MRKLLLYTMVLMVAFNFISCRSTKDMKYLQDISDGVQNISAPTPEYQIKANDNLYINVQSINVEVNELFSPSKSLSNSGGTQSDFGIVSSQYLNGYMVNQKGAIVLPVIGDVNVAGLTEEAAKDSIQRRVAEYFKDASVKVKILTYKITILGEVRTPGVYYNYNKNITILEALGLANGTTSYASIRKVLVIRNTETGNKSYRIDLTQKSMMASKAFYLLPNDVIYVEPDKYINNSINDSKFSLLLSAITATILVLNYVNK